MCICYVIQNRCLLIEHNRMMPTRSVDIKIVYNLDIAIVRTLSDSTESELPAAWGGRQRAGGGYAWTPLPTASVRWRISLTLHGVIPKCIVGRPVPSAPSLAFRSCENVNFSGCNGSVSQSDQGSVGKYHSPIRQTRLPSSFDGRVQWASCVMERMDGPHRCRAV